MPNISFSGGIVAILGSRTILPSNAGTIPLDLSPLVVDISSGTVNIIDSYAQTNILTNQTLTSSGSKNILMQNYQSLVIDDYFSSASGSILVSVLGIEPQSMNATSTIIDGTWFGGSSGAGERIQVDGPVGKYVQVAWTVVGTVTGAYLTAEVST